MSGCRRIVPVEEQGASSSTASKRSSGAQVAALLKPGGTLVYSTCSLEPEEGEAQIANLLVRREDLRQDPLQPEGVFGQREWIEPSGCLRTFPYQLDLGTPEWSGMDGFFAARLLRNK